MNSKLSLSNKLNLIAALVILFSAINANAKTIKITTNTTWSAITSGSGIGGRPTSDDSIIVHGTTGNLPVVLTVDVNGEAEFIRLGQVLTPRSGHLVVNSGVTFNVYGNLDADSTTNNKWNYVTLNTNSVLNVMGEIDGYYVINNTSGTGTFNNTWNGVPLPVEFISFTATKQANTAMLNFATAWEINNAGFEVERSTNGISWSKIGFVQGKGNSTEVNNYSFATSLVNINAPVVYYRLKQVDFNGQFEYSVVRTIRLSATAAKTTSVYPNPATSKIAVSLEGIAAGEMAKISVMDMSGKILISANQLVEEGNYTLDMNIDNLTKGNYIVNISSASSNMNVKLVKF